MNPSRYIQVKYRRGLDVKYPYHCTDCGKRVWKDPYSGRGKRHLLLLHHIKPLEIGGLDEPDNLVILCGVCHWKRHHNF